MAIDDGIQPLQRLVDENIFPSTCLVVVFVEVKKVSHAVGPIAPAARVLFITPVSTFFAVLFGGILNFRLVVVGIVVVVDDCGVLGRF